MQKQIKYPSNQMYLLICPSWLNKIIIVLFKVYYKKTQKKWNVQFRLRWLVCVSLYVNIVWVSLNTAGAKSRNCSYDHLDTGYRWASITETINSSHSTRKEKVSKYFQSILLVLWSHTKSQFMYILLWFTICQPHMLIEH